MTPYYAGPLAKKVALTLNPATVKNVADFVDGYVSDGVTPPSTAGAAGAATSLWVDEVFGE